MCCYHGCWRSFHVHSGRVSRCAPHACLCYSHQSLHECNTWSTSHSSKGPYGALYNAINSTSLSVTAPCPLTTHCVYYHNKQLHHLRSAVITGQFAWKMLSRQIPLCMLRRCEWLIVSESWRRTASAPVLFPVDFTLSCPRSQKLCWITLFIKWLKKLFWMACGIYCSASRIRGKAGSVWLLGASSPDASSLGHRGWCVVSDWFIL